MGIFIGLGANLPSGAGPPAATLAAALAKLAEARVTIAARSRWYRSPAWPNPGDPEFVNGVAAVETARDPGALLALLHAVERAFGRSRGAANAPRTLDLDLLDYRGAVLGAGPVLPHPRLHLRAFVLKPLAEIAPGWRHPVSRRSVAELIAALAPDAVAEPIGETPGN